MTAMWCLRFPNASPCYLRPLLTFVRIASLGQLAFQLCTSIGSHASRTKMLTLHQALGLYIPPGKPDQ